MRNWTAAAVTIILAAFCIMVLSTISAEGGTMWMKLPRRRSPQRNRNAGSRQPITKAGRTASNIILRILEGEPMTVKDYYEVIRDIERLAALVDAEGAVTLDHDDAEQIWALLLDYKDLLMALEVE